MRFLRTVCILLPLFLSSSSPLYAVSDTLTIRDSSGAKYFVTARYNNHNEYLHIKKVDSRGYALWEADYDTGEDKKPVSLALSSSGLIILAASQFDNTHSFSLINYSAQNFLLWERSSNTRGSVPVSLDTDADGNIYVCGNTKNTIRYNAGLWKFDDNGAQFWYGEYVDNGNSYCQDVQLLFSGDIALSVTIFPGTNNSGQYQRRSVIYDSIGRRLY